MEPSAVGFRVKSGWAVAVLLAGPPEAPVAVDRRRVELADPSVPGTVQPFHQALDLPAAAGARTVARLVEAVRRFGGRSVTELLEQYRERGHRVMGAGIVVGSDVAPSTLRNDHIRAHAEEGRLFREVIEAAAKAFGLTTTVRVEKALLGQASKAIGRPETRLKAEASALGKGLDGPWRAEEKMAALAAWLVLAEGPRG